METVKTMVLSLRSLLDTCICALSSVLVIDMNWIAARMSNELARLVRHCRANVCCSSMAKVVQCCAHSRSNQNLRCLPNSSFLSFQHWEGHTIHWFDPVRKWKLGRKWFSQSSDCLTRACVCFLFGTCDRCDLAYCKNPHQLAILSRH